MVSVRCHVDALTQFNFFRTHSHSDCFENLFSPIVELELRADSSPNSDDDDTNDLFHSEDGAFHFNQTSNKELRQDSSHSVETDHLLEDDTFLQTQMERDNLVCVDMTVFHAFKTALSQTFEHSIQRNQETVLMCDIFRALQGSTQLHHINYCGETHAYNLPSDKELLSFTSKRSLIATKVCLCFVFITIDYPFKE